LTSALYEFPKALQFIEQVATEYKKMNDEERAKLVWTGTKALIAGAVKYNVKKSIPSIYSIFLENSSWHSVVDWCACVLKKYGGNGSVNEVIEKAVMDFAEGVQNQPTS